MISRWRDRIDNGNNKRMLSTGKRLSGRKNKRRELERETSRSKDFFSDAVRGICTALSLGLEIAWLVKLG